MCISKVKEFFINCKEKKEQEKEKFIIIFLIINVAIYAQKGKDIFVLLCHIIFILLS